MTMKMMISLLLLFSLTFVICDGNEMISCIQVSVDQTNDADVIIGGLFNIHEPSLDGTGCGSAINADAIQRLEAYLFALNYLNDKSFMPGIKFGKITIDVWASNIFVFFWFKKNVLIYQFLSSNYIL